MSGSSSEIETARADMDAARHDVMESETEIQTIKNLLRQITSSSDQGTSSTLAISALTISGYPSATKNVTFPTLKLQLSSPIEELVLTKLYDPLMETDNEAESTESLVVFQDVDVSIATLTISAYETADDPTLFGTSATHDIAPLCDFDVMSYARGEKKIANIAELDVAIVPVESPSPVPLALSPPEKDDDEFSRTEVVDVVEFSDAKEEENVAVTAAEKEGATATVEGDDLGDVLKGDSENEIPTAAEITGTNEAEAEGEEQEEGTETSADGADILCPVCTIKLRVAYTPSKKDQQEKLYDLLNQASKRKAQAIERLRKSAAAVSRSRAQSTTEKDEDGEDEDAAAASSRAVQPGFLNKKKRSGGKTAGPNFLVNIYNRILGPQSLFVQVFPIAKNYCLFFGVVAFAHWKGDLLALPPPL